MRVTCLAVVALLVSPGWAAAQPSAIPRVGILYASSLNNIARLAAFRQGLQELGYIDGKSVIIEPRYAEGDLARFPALAAELVRSNVAVVVSGGPAATRSLSEATAVIPIVMVQDNDPVGSGVVASLARPGGNVTGLSNLGATISAKQLALLQETVPGLTRAAVIGTSKEPANPSALEAARRVAASLGIAIQYLDVSTPTGYRAAFRAASEGRADAVLMLASSVAVPRRKQIAAIAIEYRLPTMFPHEEYVEAGGLMTYAANITDLDRRAASYVDKILRGAKPGDLPVEQPAKFDLVVNLRTAKAIGLRIPQSVRLKADRILD